MARPTAYSILARIVTIGAVLAMAGAAQAAETLAPWRHGIVEAKGDSSVLFMPAQGGFAEKYGIDLEMVQFVSGNTPVRAIVAGQLDSIETSPVVALVAMHQGADIKIIGCHWPVMTYSVYAGGQYHRLLDLKGTNVGVSAPGSLPDLFIREALTTAGLTDDDVRFAPVGSSTDRFKAVAAGVVSAAASSGEFEIEANARGLNVLVRGAETMPNFLRSCILTTGDKIAERRDDMVRFLAGAMEGYRYALAHRDEAIAVAREVARLPPEDKTAEFVYDEAIKYSAVTPDLAIPMDKLKWTDDMMVRHGAVRESADVSQFVDDSLRQAALRLAGN